MMMRGATPLPAMTLAELFASARAIGKYEKMRAVTLRFVLQGDVGGEGTLTICRNPAATRWMTTVGVAQGERIYAKMAQGGSAGEALREIERYCYWWLGV